MSEPTVETTEPTTEATGATDTDGTETLTQIKALADELGITPGQLKGRLEASKKWEKRAKDNSEASRELEAFRQASMTDQERAVEAAKAETRTQTLREVGSHLVTAEFRAQAAGRVEPERLTEILEDLDMTKYLTDTGEVDAERVTRKVEALAPKVDTPAPFPDLGQGVRGGDLALNSDGLTAALASAVGARRTSHSL